MAKICLKMVLEWKRFSYFFGSKIYQNVVGLTKRSQLGWVLFGLVFYYFFIFIPRLVKWMWRRWRWGWVWGCTTNTDIYYIKRSYQWYDKEQLTLKACKCFLAKWAWNSRICCLGPVVVLLQCCQSIFTPTTTTTTKPDISNSQLKPTIWQIFFEEIANVSNFLKTL